MTNPPAFADLDWFADDLRFVAAATDLFWSYRTLAQGELYAAGVSITKIDDTWHAVYDPRQDKKGFAALIPDLRSLHDKAMASSEREAAHRKSAAEYRQRQEAARIEREARFAVKVEAARRKGQECLSKWGEFTVRKAALGDLIRKERIDWGDIREIDRICLQTERKAAKKAAGVAEVDGGVDWPSEIVVEALLFLTDQDDDRASVANDLGWSSSHSSTGHWCVATLQSDRDRAIAVGRTLVGKYSRQLKEAGLALPS